MEPALDEAGFTELTEGVWVATAPARIVGMRLTATMTILRLASDDLLVHSPVALTEKRRSKVEQMGRVAHIYAPNLYHHLCAGHWAGAFPDARLHAPNGLTKKRPDLAVHRIHGSETEPDFSGLVEEIPIEGFRLRESVLFHRDTGTLVVADLVHNVGRPKGSWARSYTKLMGFYDAVALSRMIRWTAFSDRALAQRSLERVLDLPIERIVVGHGTPVTASARDKLSEAFRWLKRA